MRGGLLALGLFACASPPRRPIQKIRPDIAALAGIRDVRWLGRGCYFAAPDHIYQCSLADLPPGEALCAREPVDRAGWKDATWRRWRAAGWDAAPYDGHLPRRLRAQTGAPKCHRTWYEHIASPVEVEIRDARVATSTTFVPFADLDLRGVHTTFVLSAEGTGAVCSRGVREDSYRMVVCVEPNGRVHQDPELLTKAGTELLSPLPIRGRGALDFQDARNVIDDASAGMEFPTRRCAAVDLVVAALQCRY